MPVLLADLPPLLSANAATAPIVFLDTCALLDLVRAPFRAKNAGAAELIIIAARRFLVGASSAPPSVHLVIADKVDQEWKASINSVEDELMAHLSRMEHDIDRLDKCALALGLAQPPLQRNGSLLTFSPRPLSNALLSAASVIEEEMQIKMAAFHRESRGIAPAKKGKGCLGDCIIVETVIQATEQLRSSAYLSPIVFLTSNTKDFTDTNGMLHPELAPRFSGLGIRFCTQWPHALHEAGI